MFSVWRASFLSRDVLRGSHEAQAVADAELAIDGVDVLFYGRLRDIELLGHFAVGLAGKHQLEHLCLAGEDFELADERLSGGLASLLCGALRKDPVQAQAQVPRELA